MIDYESFPVCVIIIPTGVVIEGLTHYTRILFLGGDVFNDMLAIGWRWVQHDDRVVI